MLMQGRGPGNSSPRANAAATINGSADAKILKRNMTHSLADKLCDGAKAYGWRNVNKTRYRQVDVPPGELPIQFSNSPRFLFPPPCGGGGSRNGSARGYSAATAVVNPLSLWERVGVRGYDLSLGHNPSPGSHRTMLRIAEAIRPLPMGEVKERSEFKEHQRWQMIQFQTATSLSSTTSRSRRAFRASFAGNVPPSIQRAQGMPGARCTRSLACEIK
jgi:hypothetical protein